MPFFESAVSRPSAYYSGEFYSAEFIGDNSWNGYEPNFAFLNLGPEGFVDISFILGIDSSDDDRGFVAFDFDHDGDNDLLVAGRQRAKLYVNRWTEWNRNHWLKVRLAGAGKVLPQGAIVKVAVGDRVEARPYVSENSYAASYAGPLLFGLGAAEKADAVEVVWPGGKVSRVADVPADQELVVRLQ